MTNYQPRFNPKHARALLRQAAESLCRHCNLGHPMADDGFLGLSITDHGYSWNGKEHHERCQADQVRRAAVTLALEWWAEDGKTIEDLPVLSGPNPNSQAAAAKLTEGVSGLRAKVLAFVIGWTSCTRDQISAGLKMKHQTTTARVTELLSLGYLEERGQGKSDGGNRSALLVATPAGVTAYHQYTLTQKEETPNPA